MELNLENGALLLLIAAVVAMLTRRLRLPYTAGLVAAGIGLALLPFSPTVSLTRDLIFTGLLPPLIFEAAFQLDWQQLRRDLPVVLVLASAGVLPGLLSLASTTKPPALCFVRSLPVKAALGSWFNCWSCCSSRACQ